MTWLLFITRNRFAQYDNRHLPSSNHRIISTLASQVRKTSPPQRWLHATSLANLPLTTDSRFSTETASIIGRWPNQNWISRTESFISLVTIVVPSSRRLYKVSRSKSWNNIFLTDRFRKFAIPSGESLVRARRSSSPMVVVKSNWLALIEHDVLGQQEPQENFCGRTALALSHKTVRWNLFLSQ